MNKQLIRIVAFIVVLPVVAYFGYLAFSNWNKFRVFQEFYKGATLTMQSISRIEVESRPGDREAQVDEWNKQASKKLQRFYKSYDNVKYPEIADSIKYSRALFHDVFALRLDYVDTIGPLDSERMQDRRTVRDEDEYKWRIQTLADISKYITTYTDNLNKSIDAFRESVATSNWRDNYREYAWQEWGHDLKPKLADMLPDLTEAESRIAKYQRFFAYMYKNREVYFINQKGEFIFDNKRYLDDCLPYINAMEPHWQKFGVYNVMN